MIQKTLTSVGKAMVNTIGKVADVIPQDKDTTTTLLTTQQLNDNETNGAQAQAGEFVKTLYYVVGVIGTLVILGFTIYMAKKKPKVIYRAKRATTRYRAYRRSKR